MKKTLSILLAVLMLLTTLPLGAISAGAEVGMLGDVNGDGQIDSVDATITLQYYAGILDKSADDFDITVADADASGKVDLTDCKYILQKYAGIVDIFPAEYPYGSNTLEKALHTADMFISSAKKINAENYTAESYEDLMNVIAEAEATVADAGVTEEEVEVAIAEINDAVIFLDTIDPIREGVGTIIFDGQEYFARVGDKVTLSVSCSIPDGYSVQGGLYSVKYNSGVIEPIQYNNDKGSGYVTANIGRALTTDHITADRRGVAVAFADNMYRVENNTISAEITFTVLAAERTLLADTFDLGVFSEEDIYTPITVYTDNEPVDAELAAQIPQTTVITVPLYDDVSGFEYEVKDDGTIEIIGYSGAEADITIPSTINGATVTSIADNAFADNKNLTSVTIPDSVTDIAPTAFNGCSSDLVVRGEAGSAAETFAKENGITFVEIIDVVLGDVNGDGKIDASDATNVLQVYAGILPNDLPGADVNGDGKVDAADATLILQVYAGIIKEF